MSLSENISGNIRYGDYIAEKLNETISYSDYLAEQIDSTISYSDYLSSYDDLKKKLLDKAKKKVNAVNRERQIDSILFDKEYILLDIKETEEYKEASKL